MNKPTWTFLRTYPFGQYRCYRPDTTGELMDGGDTAGPLSRPATTTITTYRRRPSYRLGDEPGEPFKPHHHRNPRAWPGDGRTRCNTGQRTTN